MQSVLQTRKCPGSGDWLRRRSPRWITRGQALIPVWAVSLGYFSCKAGSHISSFFLDIFQHSCCVFSDTVNDSTLIAPREKSESHLDTSCKLLWARQISPQPMNPESCPHQLRGVGPNPTTWGEATIESTTCLLFLNPLTFKLAAKTWTLEMLYSIGP